MRFPQLPSPAYGLLKADSCFSTARPCARCVKKGCPEECVDGARKKAKYLQEIPDEREQDFPFDCCLRFINTTDALPLGSAGARPWRFSGRSRRNPFPGRHRRRAVEQRATRLGLFPRRVPYIQLLKVPLADEPSSPTRITSTAARPAGRSFPPRRHAIPAATAITTVLRLPLPSAHHFCRAQHVRLHDRRERGSLFLPVVRDLVPVGRLDPVRLGSSRLRVRHPERHAERERVRSRYERHFVPFERSERSEWDPGRGRKDGRFRSHAPRKQQRRRRWRTIFER